MGRRGNGEGSIYKNADGSWRGSIDLGWSDGKRRRKYFRGRTRAEVVAKLRRAHEQREKGLPLGDARIRTGSYLVWWYSEHLPGTVKDSTADDYRYVIDRYVIPVVGKVPLIKLGPEHVQRMVRGMSERGLSPNTQRLARTILRRALGHAERLGLVARNVVTLTDAPRQSASRIDDSLSVNEARVLLDASHGTTLGAVVTVALGSGMRRGEVLGLTWPDIDFDAGTAAVNRTLQRRAGVGLVADDPKTERSRRVVPLTGFALTALREQRARQLEERLAHGPEWTDSGYVFTTPQGTPLDPDNVTTRFATMTERLGLGRRRFHSLRHSMATAALAAGVPLEVISRMLGHAGVAITADIYARVLPAAQRDAADRLEAAFRAV